MTSRKRASNVTRAVVIILFLTSLNGCASMMASPLIDRVPPGSPKGFVEFYMIIYSGFFRADEFDGQYFNQPKARPEYSSCSNFGFAIQEIPRPEGQILPIMIFSDMRLPIWRRRIAKTPGDHNFFLYAGGNPVLEPEFRSALFSINVTEGMITPIRIEAKKLQTGFVYARNTEAYSLKLVPCKLIPVTSIENSLAVYKQFLKDSDWTVRLFAARELGEIADPNAIEILKEALKDDIWEVKIQAGYSLLKFKDVRDAKIVDLLTEVFIKDLNGSHVPQIGYTGCLLGEFGDERAVAPLERCVNEKYDPLFPDDPIYSTKTKCSYALRKIKQRIKK